MSILGAEFDDAVNRLKIVGNDFMVTYNQFVNIPDQFKPAAWFDVKSYADSVRNVIAYTTSAIDQAYQYAASVFGLAALRGLNAVPLALPITVLGIGAAISAILLARGKMVEILNDAENRRRITEINIGRVEQGLEPLDPDSFSPTNITLSDNIANMVKYGVIGLVAFLVIPRILEGMKK